MPTRPLAYRLTADEERALAHSLPDQKARDRLFASCYPYVLRTARRFQTRKLRTQELAQVGAIGLLRAIDKFQPGKARLITYAAPWITQELQRYVSQNQFLANLGTNPPMVKARSLARRAPIALSPEELAEKSGLEVEMCNRLTQTLEYGDMHLVTSMGEHVDLPVEPPDQHVIELRTRVREAVSRLPDSQREAIEGVYFRERSLGEVGRELGCSHQNVDQRARDGMRAIAPVLRALVVSCW